MGSIIFILLAALNGAMLGHAGIVFTDWHFWVITGCVCGAYLCGTSRD